MVSHHDDGFDITEELIRVSSKLELLDRMVPKLLHFQHKTVIFCQLRMTMDLIAEAFIYRHVAYARLDDESTIAEQHEAIARFHSTGTTFLIVSTRAGSVGLNLQVADTVIVYESDFDPEVDKSQLQRCLNTFKLFQIEIRDWNAILSNSVTIRSMFRSILCCSQQMLQWVLDLKCPRTWYKTLPQIKAEFAKFKFSIAKI